EPPLERQPRPALRARTGGARRLPAGASDFRLASVRFALGVGLAVAAFWGRPARRPALDHQTDLAEVDGV
ncbi:MAG: hypothetical protein AVDCRST_MAG53-878, partial [uncultured Solirubrobacteraceae bacterium]